MRTTANGTYTVVVDGQNIGPFGIIDMRMTINHVRQIRARDGVTNAHRPFIDGSPAQESALISPNAKVEFRRSKVGA